MSKAVSAKTLPPRTRRRHVDHEGPEQTMLARWLDWHRILWCHVPNGGARNVLVARKLKREGCKSGIPDCLIFDPPPINPSAPGTALELKAQRAAVKYAKPTGMQLQWLGDLADRGWHVIVAHGAAEAIEQLQRAGYGR